MPQNQSHRFRNFATECLAGSVAIALITFVCFQLRLDPLIPACLYLISLILLSLRGSFVSSVVVSFIAVGCLDYYFIPPIFSITISNPSSILTLITFLVTLTVIARLVSGKQRLLQEKFERGEAYLSEAQRLSHTGKFRLESGYGRDPLVRGNLSHFPIRPEDGTDRWNLFSNGLIRRTGTS